jgi:hypothetical protein
MKNARVVHPSELRYLFATEKEMLACVQAMLMFELAEHHPSGTWWRTQGRLLVPAHLTNEEVVEMTRTSLRLLGASS